MEKVVAEFPKNSMEKVVAGTTRYNGKDLFYFRVFFKGKDDNWHPTKKGIILSIGCFSDFEKAFAKLKKFIDDM